MTDVWSIGHRTAAHLARMGITSMYELAHANPYALKQELGILGTQLFATAWGIDRTKISQRIVTRQPSIGNSQVLPRDYRNQFEIEIVIKEIGEQVAARLRHHRKRAGEITLGIGFSYAESQADGRTGFSQAKRMLPTNRDSDIVTTLREIFRDNWHGEVVRNVASTPPAWPRTPANNSIFLNRSISKSRQQTWNERLMRSAIDSALKHSSTPKAPCTAVPPFSAHHL